MCLLIVFILFIVFLDVIGIGFIMFIMFDLFLEVSGENLGNVVIWGGILIMLFVVM